MTTIGILSIMEIPKSHRNCEGQMDRWGQDHYDSNGNAIVTQTDADAIGLVAGGVDSKSQTALINKLST